MAVKEILTLPDKKLVRTCEPVELSSETTSSLAEDLSDTTDESPGFALAAPQIGVLKRAICVDVSQADRDSPTDHGKAILFNPRVVEGQNRQSGREGCLSIPEYTGNVERFQEITVEGSTPADERVRLKSKGWEAVAFQHEIDHLDGILFIDRISSLEEDLFRRNSN